MTPTEARENLESAQETCADALANLVGALTLEGHWPTNMLADDRCIACNALLAAGQAHAPNCAALEADGALEAWQAALDALDEAEAAAG